MDNRTASLLEDLSAQFQDTPDPAESFSPTGQHYVLASILNKIGLYPMSREEAYNMAEELLLNNGY